MNRQKERGGCRKRSIARSTSIKQVHAWANWLARDSGGVRMSEKCSRGSSSSGGACSAEPAYGEIPNFIRCSPSATKDWGQQYSREQHLSSFQTVHTVKSTVVVAPCSTTPQNLKTLKYSNSRARSEMKRIITSKDRSHRCGHLDSSREHRSPLHMENSRLADHTAHKRAGVVHGLSRLSTMPRLGGQLKA